MPRVLGSGRFLKGRGASAQLAPERHQRPCQELLANRTNIVTYHDMNREMFIAKLTEVQQTVEQLLAQLQASEHDKFAAHLYRSRREYRLVCERAGKKGGKQIERCVISTFQVAGSMGFKRDFRQWEDLLRIGGV